MQSSVVIHEIPEPFRGFLCAKNETPRADALLARGDVGDLLFLAAILMLCDD